LSLGLDLKGGRKRWSLILAYDPDVLKNGLVQYHPIDDRNPVAQITRHFLTRQVYNVMHPCIVRTIYRRQLITGFVDLSIVYIGGVRITAET